MLNDNWLAEQLAASAVSKRPILVCSLERGPAGECSLRAWHATLTGSLVNGDELFKRARLSVGDVRALRTFHVLTQLLDVDADESAALRRSFAETLRARYNCVAHFDADSCSMTPLAAK